MNDFLFVFFVFVSTIVVDVSANASSLSCGTSLTAGTTIMGSSAVSSISRSVTLTNSNGDTMTDGDTYTAGESLTAALSSTVVIHSRVSVDSLSSCSFSTYSFTRAVNSNSVSVTAPTDGSDRRRGHGRRVTGQSRSRRPSP